MYYSYAYFEGFQIVISDREFDAICDHKMLWSDVIDQTPAIEILAILT